MNDESGQQHRHGKNQPPSFPSDGITSLTPNQTPFAKPVTEPIEPSIDREILLGHAKSMASFFKDMEFGWSSGISPSRIETGAAGLREMIV